MTTSLTLLARSGLVATLSLGVTWLAVASWTPFTQRRDFIVPLLVIALGMAVLGTLARALLRRGLWAWLLTSAVVAVTVFWMIPALFPGEGAGLNDAGPWADWSNSLATARAAAQTFAAPVPQTAPSIAPLLVLGGTLALVLVDLVINSLRLVVVGGLLLLALCVAPVAVTGERTPWWLFAIIATGYLCVLYLLQSDALYRWGHGTDREVSTVGDQSQRSGFNQPSRLVALAAGMGVLAVGTALVVPAVVSLPSNAMVEGSGWGAMGRGNGDNDTLEVTNPSADMRRDLERGEDRPVLRVVTNNPNPSYLRLGTLNAFNGNAWTPGDRQVELSADGEFPPIPGLARADQRPLHRYEVNVLPILRSDWLPTMQLTVSARTSTAWTVDPTTLDVFHGGDEDATTAGEQYSFTAVDPAFTPEELQATTSGAGQVPELFTDLPSDLPPVVGRLAREATAGADSDFGKAQALQNWFRNAGGFRYSLARAPIGSGNGTIERFLDERVGYCEQFSATMAVMARELGMPARVAVGWLNPSRVGTDTFEYSSHDAHAWTEIYFAGTGWVAFEPTPATRASRVPSYTRENPQDSPSGSPSASASASTSSSPSASARPTSQAPAASSSPTAGPVAGQGSEDQVPVGAVVGVLAGVLALVGLLLGPRILRAGRRARRRRSADPEAAWTELLDTARDLGLDAPQGRSLRESGSWLVERLAAPADTRTGASRTTGPHADPPAAAEIEALVMALENARYAPTTSRPTVSRRGGSAHGDSARGDSAESSESWRWPSATLTALTHGVSATARTRAVWWPRSLGSRSSH